jgi:hypothetical protein
LDLDAPWSAPQLVEQQGLALPAYVIIEMRDRDGVSTLAGNDIVAKMKGVKDGCFLFPPSHKCFNVQLGHGEKFSLGVRAKLFTLNS